MALLPIDLQTVFTQASQVGKEQAVQKNAPPIAQSLQGAQLVQQAVNRDKAVNETHDQEEGPEKVKERTRRGAERRKRQKKGAQPPPSQSTTSDVVHDPALGRNVDITG
ncbi:MAG: hypothetical protein ABSG21_07295 [Spirochaetia bacterium]|jgi:hypothetical protein